MQNWGYFSTIFSSWNFHSFINTGNWVKNRLRRNMFKFFFSFIAMIYLGHALMKIYEVPVYVTKFDVLASDIALDKDKGISIFLFRNYDRDDKGTLYRDSVWKKWNSRSEFSGGINVYGHGKAAEGITIGNKARISMVKDTLSNLYKRFRRTPIDDSRLLYLSIQTTKRQSLQPPTALKNFEHIYSSKNSIQYNTLFNGYEIVDDTIEYHKYFEYESKRMQDDYNSAIYENIIAVSKEDSTIAIHSNFSTTAFGSPNLFVAEDVSKLVEVIYVGKNNISTDSITLWSAVKNLIFEYSGPAEFSEHIIPEPDKITVSSLQYTDSMKIQEIGRSGLRIHVKLPDMENKQESRIFILSAVVTALGALVLRYFWRIIIDINKKISFRLQRRKIIKSCLVILVLIGSLWIIIQMSRGCYYSYVNPFAMFNPFVD